MIYKLIFLLILTAILAAGCSGSAPVSPQYYPEVGPLRPDHWYLEGYTCPRDGWGQGKCFSCHVML